MLAQCERALEAGLTHIAFTDHLEIDPRHEFYNCYDYARARGEFDSVEEKFGDRISLFFGVEVTCHTSIEGMVREALAGKDFDVVIGSIHFLEEFGGDISSHSRAPKIFENNEPGLVYRKYLDEVEASINSGLFDVIGHIGIVHRHGPPCLKSLDLNRFEPMFRRIAEAIAESGVTVEVNSSGFNHPPNTTYPDEKFIEMIVNTGGRNFTVGSDAHGPEGLGAHIGEAMDSIRRCGIDEIVCFEDRKMKRCKFS